MTLDIEPGLVPTSRQPSSARGSQRWIYSKSDIQWRVRSPRSHAGEQAMSGIQTLADLRDRCHICADSGCWIPVVGGRSHRNGTRQACVYLPALGNSSSIGIACYFLMTGKKPPANMVFAVQCGTRDCANPEHRRMVKRGFHVKANPCSHDRLMAITKAVRRNWKSRAEESARSSQVRARIRPLRKHLACMCRR